jgi:hypothetical protein
MIWNSGRWVSPYITIYQSKYDRQSIKNYHSQIENYLQFHVSEGPVTRIYFIVHKSFKVVQERPQIDLKD